MRASSFRSSDRPDRANRRRTRIHPWWLARKITAALFLGALVLGTVAWFDVFRGSTTGTTALGIIPFSDPLAAIEVMLATRTWQPTLLIGAGILVAGALVLGPVFCGWICPLGFVLDLNHSLRNLVRRMLRRKREHDPIAPSPSPVIRNVLLGFALGFSLLAGIPIFQIVSPINVLARGLLFGLVAALGLIVLIMVIEFVRPRWWCRAICPLGAFYSLIGQFGILRVRINPALAGKTPCGECTRHCPMGIRVLEDYAAKGRSSVTHPHCTRCGECIDLCPRGVLRLRFRNIRERVELNDDIHDALPPGCVGRESGSQGTPGEPSPNGQVELTPLTVESA